MDASFIQKLNSTAKSLGIAEKILFHAEDPVDVVVKIAPYGKAAVIYSKTAFIKHGKTFTEKLKKSGVKPLNFIMPNDDAKSFENVFDVIGIPEDVRAIVCADFSVKDVCAYIASLFDIPVVYVINSVRTYGLFAARARFRFNNRYDLPLIRCVRHIAFIKTALPESDTAEQYADLMSEIPALTDYRVYSALSGKKASKAAYDLMKSAVKDAFGESGATPVNLLYQGLNAELADFASSGVIHGNSAAYCFLRLNGFAEEKGLKFTLLSKILLFYALCAEQIEDAFNLPDYNARAAELAALTHFDDGEFLKGFLEQLKHLKGKEKLKQLKVALKAELSAQSAAVPYMRSVYEKLGGESLSDFTPHAKAFKHCGDVPETLNFMTVVRESGLCEYI